jgi:enoyl-CoA hydratase/carnithine racemase
VLKPNESITQQAGGNRLLQAAPGRFQGAKVSHRIRLARIQAWVWPGTRGIFAPAAARRLLLLGNTLGSEEARTIRLVDEVVAPKTLDED